MSVKKSYPTVWEPLRELCKTLFLESGVIGTLAFLATFNLYQGSVAYLRTIDVMDDAKIFALIVSVAHAGIWLLCNVPFLVFDKYGHFQQYKLHRVSHQIPTSKILTKTFIEAGISLFVTTPILTYFMYPAFVSCGLTALDAPSPPLLDIYTTMLVGHIFNDVFFYFTHRMFHSKELYWIHKQHHSYTGTISLSAEFANPIEVLVANVFPTLGGVVCFGCHHPLCFIVWFLIRLQQTYFAHSGYCFKDTWLDFIGLGHAKAAIFHDHHHTSNVGNFGSFYMDYIFGTMDHFNAMGLYAGYLQKKEKKSTGRTSTSVKTLIN
jgi:sterol desaturase/sphingolipid hydroxylase (fatty acid hydroxylase superfamily)